MRPDTRHWEVNWCSLSSWQEYCMCLVGALDVCEYFQYNYYLIVSLIDAFKRLPVHKVATVSSLQDNACMPYWHIILLIHSLSLRGQPSWWVQWNDVWWDAVSVASRRPSKGDKNSVLPRSDHRDFRKSRSCASNTLVNCSNTPRGECSPVLELSRCGLFGEITSVFCLSNVLSGLL